MSETRRWLGMLVKDIVGRAMVLLGLHRRRLRGRPVVVAFHSVVAGRTDGALRCGVDDLDAYCRFFRRHMGVVSLTEALQLAGAASAGGEVVVTFDDGYADNAELALPVLKRHSIPATVFVTTSFVGSEHQTHWDQQAGVRSRWMNWEQVRELHDSGIDIGCHTCNHIDMARVSIEDAREEVVQSSAEIERQVGKKAAHFAIPYGRSFEGIDAATEMVLGLGFQSVWLCRGGIRFPTRSQRYGERVPIMPGDYLSPYGWLVDVLRDAPFPSH